MRIKNLMGHSNSRRPFLLPWPIHSLLILFILLLLPNKTASRAIPIYSQVSLNASDRLDNSGRYENTDITMMKKEETTLASYIHKITIRVIAEHATSTMNMKRDSSSIETTPLQSHEDSVASNSLSTAQKIWIGVGVPLGIIFLGSFTFILTRRYLQRRRGMGNTETGRDGNGEGAFTGLDSGRDAGWFAGRLGSSEVKPPPSSHLESSNGPTEVETWGPLSGKLSHPIGGVAHHQRENSMNDTSRPIGEDWIHGTFQGSIHEKRRPTDLQPLSLSASPHRSFGTSSQASPGPFSSPGPFAPPSMNSPQLRPGHQSTMSSKSSSTLGLSAFFTPPPGHERHGSASTRISQKSRKGSTATMMTGNYDLEMATLCSTSEQPYPMTPGDCDGVFPTRIYRTSAYSCLDSEREDITITPIKSQAYIQRSQSPMFLPSNLPSPSPTTRSRHRHSRTSSSGINAANIVNSIPSMFTNPKPRPGTSPLAAGAKGKTIRKEDIRIINHETTYFDDGDDDDDEEGDSVSSKLPSHPIGRRQSRRHSAGPKRMSKRQSSEVDGEELWTDSEDERDSGDFVIPGGLGSRFGKKEPEMSGRGGGI